MRSYARAVAGVVTWAARSTGVDVTTTPPAVFRRRLNFVICAVAVALPREPKVIDVMRKVLPLVMTKDTAEEVAPVPADLFKVIAVSVVVVPEATPVA